MLLVKTSVDRSSINGLGVFASQEIPKGTIISRVEPEFDKSYENLEIFPEPAKSYIKKYGYLSKGVWWVDGDNLRYCNHSICEYNVQYSFECDYGVATKDIHVTDEILCNYFDFDESAGDKINGRCQ